MNRGPFLLLLIIAGVHLSGADESLSKAEIRGWLAEGTRRKLVIDMGRPILLCAMDEPERAVKMLIENFPVGSVTPTLDAAIDKLVDTLHHLATAHGEVEVDFVGFTRYTDGLYDFHYTMRSQRALTLYSATWYAFRKKVKLLDVNVVTKTDPIRRKLVGATRFSGTFGIDVPYKEKEKEKEGEGADQPEVPEGL